jgi:hypothetical protein
MTLRNYIYKTKKIRFTHIFAVASKATTYRGGGYLSLLGNKIVTKYDLDYYYLPGSWEPKLRASPIGPQHSLVARKLYSVSTAHDFESQCVF